MQIQRQLAVADFIIGDVPLNRLFQHHAARRNRLFDDERLVAVRLIIIVLPSAVFHRHAPEASERNLRQRVAPRRIRAFQHAETALNLAAFVGQRRGFIKAMRVHKLLRFGHVAAHAFQDADEIRRAAPLEGKTHGVPLIAQQLRRNVKRLRGLRAVDLDPLHRRAVDADVECIAVFRESRGGQMLEQRGGDAGIGAGRTPADPRALRVQPLHRLRGHVRLRRDGLRRQQRERGCFDIAFEPPERRIRRPKRERRAGRAIGLPRRPRRQHAVDFRRQFRPVQPVKHQRQQREAARAQAVALPIHAVDMREIHVSGDGQGVKQIGFDFVLRRALKFPFQVIQPVLQDIRPDAPANALRLSQQAHGVRRHEQIALRRHARPIPAAVRVLTLLNIVQQRLEAQPRLS